MAIYKDGISVDCTTIKDAWAKKINDIFTEATLAIPEKIFMQTGGKTGIHSEHMGFILADLQYVQRAYPDSEW